ncbi:hypothetical protein VPH35_046256 [Triticum aestivum]
MVRWVCTDAADSATSFHSIARTRAARRDLGVAANNSEVQRGLARGPNASEASRRSSERGVDPARGEAGSRSSEQEADPADEGIHQSRAMRMNRGPADPLDAVEPPAWKGVRRGR